MVTMIVLAILLTLNMLLLHSDKLYQLYVWIYTKVFSPKFKVGEIVMIDDVQFEVITIAKSLKPYTYFVLPIGLTRSRYVEHYYHESKLKKKTGLLKELE
jgi:hypothetical protein